MNATATVRDIPFQALSRLPDGVTLEIDTPRGQAGRDRYGIPYMHRFQTAKLPAQTVRGSRVVFGVIPLEQMLFGWLDDAEG